MPILDSIKGAFVKSALNKLVDGDKGSTTLGLLAGALLAANLDFGLILQGLHDQKSAMECGKAAAIVALVLWSRYIGKKPADPVTPVK